MKFSAAVGQQCVCTTVDSFLLCFKNYLEYSFHEYLVVFTDKFLTDISKNKFTDLGVQVPFNHQDDTVLSYTDHK